MALIAVDEKVLTHQLDPSKTRLPECIGILLIIPDVKIGEMPLEYLMVVVLPRGGYSAFWFFSTEELCIPT